jgi:hypothetical protein
MHTSHFGVTNLHINLTFFLFQIKISKMCIFSRPSPEFYVWQFISSLLVSDKVYKNKHLLHYVREEKYI